MDRPPRGRDVGRTGLSTLLSQSIPALPSGKRIAPSCLGYVCNKAEARDEWEGRVWRAEASFVWHQTELMLEPAARADPRMDLRK